MNEIGRQLVAGGFFTASVRPSVCYWSLSTTKLIGDSIVAIIIASVASADDIAPVADDPFEKTIVCLRVAALRALKVGHCAECA